MIYVILNLIIGFGLFCFDSVVSLVGYIGISNSLNLLHVVVGFFVRFLIDLVALVFDFFILYLHWLFTYWDFLLAGQVKKSATPQSIIKNVVGKSPRHFIKKELAYGSRERVKSVASAIDSLVVTDEMREKSVNWLLKNIRSLEERRKVVLNRLSIDRDLFKLDYFCGLQLLLGLLDVKGVFTCAGGLHSKLSSISIEVTMYNRELFDWIIDTYDLGYYELCPIFRDGEIDNLRYVYRITEGNGLGWFRNYLLKHKLLGVHRSFLLEREGYVMSNPDLNEASDSRWLGIIIGSGNVVQHMGSYAIEFCIGGHSVNMELISQFTVVLKERWNAHRVPFTGGNRLLGCRWHIVNEASQKFFIQEFSRVGLGQITYEFLALRAYYGCGVSDTDLFRFMEWVTPLIDLTLKPTEFTFNYFIESIKMDSYRLLREDRFLVIEQRLEDDAVMGLIDFRKVKWGFVEKWMYQNLVLGERLTMGWGKLDKKDRSNAMFKGDLSLVPGPYDASRHNEFPNKVRSVTRSPRKLTNEERKRLAEKARADLEKAEALFKSRGISWPTKEDLLRSKKDECKDDKSDKGGKS